jgi:hypothetical protein
MKKKHNFSPENTESNYKLCTSITEHRHIDDQLKIWSHDPIEDAEEASVDVTRTEQHPKGCSNGVKPSTTVTA